MEKRLLQFVLLCAAFVFVWKVWQPFWKFDLNEAVDNGSTEKVVFTIEKGSSAKTIAANLEDQDLIEHEKSFIRTVESEGLDAKLRYGSFVLSPGMTLRDIVTTLTTEGSGELAFTAIEGWTIEEMDAQLVELGLIEAGDFTDCAKTCDFEYDFIKDGQSLEGYLFPDTYFIDSSRFTSEILINMMLQNFDAKFTDEMDEQLEASGRTLDQVVNVASMIEREVRTEDDLPIVSGIIWKRLDNDWYLGIDATLLYVQDDNELTAADLAMDSPYNTRLTKGLPPTPINNPGLASLEAALNPEESEYWFYLTTLDTGEVIYGRTEEEHNANKEKYL